MQILNLPLLQLKPYEKNAKLHSDKQVAQVAESIKQFGWAQPLVVDNADNLIIGHCRLEAAKLLELETVPCIRMDKLTEEEVKALRLADNKLNESAWAGDLVLNELTDLDLKGFDVSITGFTLDDMVQGSAKDDKMPTIAPPVTVFGDVWRLGRHKLVCGDATQFGDVENLMGGVQASMAFTDPPYNVNYQGGAAGEWKKAKRAQILNDKMSAEKFYLFLLDVFKNMLAFTSGAFYVCMSSSELHNLWAAFTDAGGHWQSYIIWVKNHFTLSRSDYHHQMEPIMLGNSDPEKDTDSEGEVFMYGWHKNHFWKGGRKQGNLWHFDKPAVSKEHPTMKPVMLCCKAILNSSEPGQVVLDLFGGSGSTLIACEKTGRSCYMMEMDPHYVDVIIKRWEEYSGQVAVKL